MYGYLPLSRPRSEIRVVKTQKAPKGIEHPEKANIGIFKHSFRIIFSGRLFIILFIPYTTKNDKVKTEKANKNRPWDLRWKDKEYKAKEMPCKTVSTFHRANRQVDRERVTAPFQLIGSGPLLRTIPHRSQLSAYLLTSQLLVLFQLPETVQT